MADIVCPECGLVTSLTAIRRAADEFCAHCDYPLFWAPTALPLDNAPTLSTVVVPAVLAALAMLVVGGRARAVHPDATRPSRLREEEG